MAINYTVSYTFSPNSTISSSQVNTNFSDNSGVWTGLEAKTKSFSNLVVDATPTSATDVAIKSYVDKLNNYRRPVLQYSTPSVVNLETGINGTSGQAQILFPDGTLRTDSTSTRINFDITRNAALSGTAQSGLRTSLTEAANTWYALYAVKVTDSSSNFVVVGDTVLPLQANYATLNSSFGTSGWSYLGMARNGDNSAATGDILDFVMAGNVTRFRSVATGQSGFANGILVASSASAASVTWTYSAGTGTVQVPNHINMGYVIGATNNSTNDFRLRNSSASYDHYLLRCGGGVIAPAILVYFNGDNLSGTTGAGAKIDIFWCGWVDGLLGIGANPLL